MAVLKWASTGLGWGGGLSRLPSAAPWHWVSTPKLPLGGIQHCQPALFLLLKGCTMAILRRLLLAAGRARAARASARARLAKFERVLPPGRLKAAGGSTRLARRVPAALAAAPGHNLNISTVQHEVLRSGLPHFFFPFFFWALWAP